MALTITLILLSLLEVMPDFHCAPARYGVGFNMGVKNELNLTFNTIGLIDSEATTLKSGDIGAKWKGSSYNNAYAAINNHYIGHKSETTKRIDGTIHSSSNSTRFKNIGDILQLHPSLDVINKSDVSEKSEFLIGEDAKRMAASIGDLGGYNGQEGLHSKITRAWPIKKSYTIFVYFATFSLFY